MDKFDDKRNQENNGVDDFLSQFDEETFNKPLSQGVEDGQPDVHRSRKERKAMEKKSRSEAFKEKSLIGKAEQIKSEKITNDDGAINKTKQYLADKFLIENENYVESGSNMESDQNMRSDKKKHKKYKLNKKQFLKFILAVIIAVIVVVIVYSAVIIISAPKIDPDNIYSFLTESSVLYDDEGEVIDNVFSEQNRTNVEYKDLPEDMKDAIIAIEDKTFEKHHGFNFIRILGAIKDGILHGHISGTSTITQQLARNVYLPDRMTERSIGRKILEAYYTVVLESKLTKDQIMEAYLNTIYLGYGCYGVQAAAQGYFSKDIQELTLEECAALAALPQSPSEFQLIDVVDSDSVSQKAKNIIKRTGDVTYVSNDASGDRRELCLDLMLEQKKITQAEHDKAMGVSLKKMLNPSHNTTTNSSYFTDYVINQVASDLAKKNNIDYDEAVNWIYTKGYHIYTTMDSTAQEVIEKEFDNPSNFPTVVGIMKDKNGNIINKHGSLMLYDYDNYFDSNDNFNFRNSEIKKNDDGSYTIIAGKRLNIYETTVAGKTDYSIEFKNMYIQENSQLYSISGGYVNIPQDYKTQDSDGNIIISADFFDDYPTFFNISDSGKVSIPPDSYTLNQRVIQPQAAMAITENSTGEVKAMVGGRSISGRMLYNRATNPRQPGSSIKPLGVYSAALQKSCDAVNDGETLTYTEGLGEQGTSLYGDYLTAASLIDDEPMMLEGRIWPQNSYSGFSGLYSMRTALQQSVNVCAVKIWAQVGDAYSSKNVQKFGITTVDTEGDTNDLNAAALALGGMTSGVTPLEMSSAYTTFVNGGVRQDTICYTKIENRNGDTILQSQSKKNEVLDPGVAFIMCDMLQSVVSQGIGSPARISGVQSGGKTGTTTDQYDIWFDGFTPSYSAALWIGNDVNIALSSSSYTAAVLWGKIMNQIPNAKKGSYKGAPSNVVSSTAYSKGRASEYFIAGTQRSKKDSVRKTVTVCSQSGYLATPLCPNAIAKSGIQRPYIPSTKVGDYKSELPHYYCNRHNNDTITYPIKPGLKLHTYTPPVVEPDPDEPVDPDNPVVDPENPDTPTDDTGSTKKKN